MPVILQSGKDGNTAEVDDHGRLAVRAIMVSHLHHHTSYHNNSFSFPFSCTLPDGNETEIALIVNNSKDQIIEMHSVLVSADTAIEIQTKLNVTYDSGGTVVTPVNLHTGSKIPPSADAYEGGASADLVVVETSAGLSCPLFIGANSPVDLGSDGAISIAPGHGFYIAATGLSGNKVKGSISFTFHGLSVKL